jgi:hypothetical protein
MDTTADASAIKAENKEAFGSIVVDFLVRFDGDLEVVVGSSKLVGDFEVVDGSFHVVGEILTGIVDLVVAFGQPFPGVVAVFDVIVVPVECSVAVVVTCHLLNLAA